MHQSGFALRKPPTTQGNRISKEGQQPGKVGFIPAGSLDLAPERSFFGVLLHDVQGHVAENCKIMGSVSQTASVLILVEDDVEPPVQPIFDAPMRANNLVEAFGRQSGAEQVIGGLGRCLAELLPV